MHEFYQKETYLFSEYFCLFVSIIDISKYQPHQGTSHVSPKTDVLYMELLIFKNKIHVKHGPENKLGVTINVNSFYLKDKSVHQNVGVPVYI